MVHRNGGDRHRPGGLRVSTRRYTMAKYSVSANGVEFGVYEADDAQGARDACAVDAGYKSEADMVEQLEQASELVATEA